ncbi:hypothetical protein Ga0609869_000699 [Rhodovulum iodosum]|uniref:Uncharacterized protein n=1 Tax=Rhodovulum iodosum TaxID=68291 RepID=A0ABV3XPU0_9RHOB
MCGSFSVSGALHGGISLVPRGGLSQDGSHERMLGTPRNYSSINRRTL